METLKTLFRQWAGEPCVEALAIGAGGSSRRYFRLLAASGRSAIGAIASDRRENEAFFAFTRHLHAKGIRVPQLYAVADDRCHYLQQDLGDQTLYGLLYEKKRQGGGFDSQMLNLYRSALADLADIQLAGADIDFSVAYPTPAFDRRSILWDLNYFKYYYLKLADIPFDEQLLEDDFSRLADLLLQADCNYFMYRDFQGRNIMVVERVESGKWKVESGKSADAPATNAITQSHNNALLYYIDYQGGRRGAAQYDVASLLYSAKSDLPEPIRRELLDHYLDHRGIRGTDRRRWLDPFWLYVYIRILQTLGAYGFRGLYQRKDYFIQSIPLALQNLRRLADEHPLPQETKYLYGVIKSVVDSGEWVVDSKDNFEIRNSKYEIQNSLAAALGQLSAFRVLLYQGAVNMGRGVDWAIDALEFLPDCCLVVAGGGDLLAEMKRYAAEKAWADRVLFLGRLAPYELERLTPMADVGLVMLEDRGLSYHYALPNRIGDFVAAGVPMVVSDLPEMSAVVRKFDIGEVIAGEGRERHEAELLAEAVRRVLERGKANYDFAAARADMDWDKEKQKLISILNAITL